MPSVPDVAPARRTGRLPAAAVAAHDAALVAAAGRLFRRHGYAGTSIDMIAREAQASPKTLYARYGGKLGLFRAVIDGLVERPLSAWDALDPAADPSEVLPDAADRFLAVVLSPDVLAMERAIIAEAPRLPELAETFYARGPRRGLDRLAGYLAELAARGRVRADDPHATAELFIGMIEGELVRRALFLGEEPDAATRRGWVDRAVRAFLAALAPGTAA